MANLKDNRKYQAMSFEEADSLFLQIAHLRSRIEREASSHKKKLAELELAHKEKVDPLARELDQLQEELSSFILANPEKFLKPRKHLVGQIGSYGIVTDPAYCRIDNKEAFLQFAMENGYEDLYRTDRIPDKAAIMERALAGEKLEGVTVIGAGDVAKISFKKGYAEALEEGRR